VVVDTAPFDAADFAFVFLFAVGLLDGVIGAFDAFAEAAGVFVDAASFQAAAPDLVRLRRVYSNDAFVRFFADLRFGIDTLKGALPILEDPEFFQTIGLRLYLRINLECLWHLENHFLLFLVKFRFLDHNFVVLSCACLLLCFEHVFLKQAVSRAPFVLRIVSAFPRNTLNLVEVLRRKGTFSVKKKQSVYTLCAGLLIIAGAAPFITADTGR